jgi:hypothetical protein
MDWDEEALQRIPYFVRGMVSKEIERCAREMGLDRVNKDAMQRANETWMGNAGFHSESNPDQYKG